MVVPYLIQNRVTATPLWYGTILLIDNWGGRRRFGLVRHEMTYIYFDRDLTELTDGVSQGCVSNDGGKAPTDENKRSWNVGVALVASADHGTNVH